MRAELIPPLLAYHVVGGGGPNLNAYADHIVALFGANIISYLPLWESEGVYADDYYTTNKDGTYFGTGVAYGETGIGDGRTSVKLDGSTGRINWYSAGLASAFNGATGTISVWAKVASSGIWTDGATHNIVFIKYNASNYISIAKTSANGRVEFNYVAGGTAEQYRKESVSSTDWINFCCTWSKADEKFECYVNGTRVGGTTTLGTWTGAPDGDITLLGAAAWSTGSNAWSGWMAHALLLNRAATPAEVADIATIPLA